MNYYISDTHFGHENVLKFDNRPFHSVDEMDEVLITKWNDVVNDTDDVYIIGDFVYKSKKPVSWYLKQLKGRKHLIQGNHDYHLLKDVSLVKEFESIDNMTYVKDGKYTVVLCHYPIAEWNKYWRGSWHIYGHIHKEKKRCFDYMFEEERALNAGCMINHYTPVTIEQLIENNRKYKENYLWELYGNNTGPLQLENGSWILPSKLLLEDRSFMEEGDVHYVFSEYCKSGLIYHFNIAGERDHEHAFSAVLEAAYKSNGLFEIDESDKCEYSTQELAFLEKLVAKIRKDRELDV